MGLVKWYMGLFEKKGPAKVEVEDAQPVHEAVNTDLDKDVSFNAQGVYSLDLGNGYKVAMRKQNQPGLVTVAVSGPGIEDYQFVSYMKMVLPSLSQGNNNLYSQKVFNARVNLKSAITDLNRLRDQAVSHIEKVRETRQKWDEI